MLGRRFLTLVLAASFSASATSRDEELLREAGKAAAINGTERIVAGYLDKIASAGAQSAATNAAGAAAAGGANAGASAAEGGISAGSEFIFAVQIGLAAKDFADAKTDKAKGFAVAEAYAAGLALANPVAGLAATAVIVTVQMLDARQSAQHAKDLMAVYTRVLDDYKKAAELEKKMTTAEAIAFKNLVIQLSDAEKNVETGRDYLRAHCMAPDQMEAMDSIDGCVKSLIQIYSQYRIMTDISNQLLTSVGRRVDLGKALASVNLTREQIQSFQKSFQESTDSLRATLQQTLDGYSEMLSQALQQQASEQAGLTQALLYKENCLDRIRRLNLRALTVLEQPLSADSRTLNDAMDDFNETDCHQIQSGDADLQKMYERNEAMYLDLQPQVVELIKRPL